MLRRGHKRLEEKKTLRRLEEKRSLKK